MTTPELLSLMRLLSAMESAMLTAGKSLPDHIWDDVTRHVEILEREILSRSNLGPPQTGPTSTTTQPAPTAERQAQAQTPSSAAPRGAALGHLSTGG